MRLFLIRRLFARAGFIATHSGVIRRFFLNGVIINAIADAPGNNSVSGEGIAALRFPCFAPFPYVEDESSL